MDFSIDYLSGGTFGLFSPDGALLDTFSTPSAAEIAARTTYGFPAPAPLDPVMYSGDMDAVLDMQCLTQEAAS